MKILAIVEFVRSELWRQERWGPTIVRGLCGRGHEVTLACEGSRDLGEFGCARVIARRPMCVKSRVRPMGFARWAEGLDIERDVVLSLAPTARGDVWLPLGAWAGEAMGRSLRSGNPVRMVMDMAANPHLAGAIAAERRARSGSGRRLTIGPTRDGFTSIGHASVLEPMGAEEMRRARGELRRAIGIADSARVVAVSGVHLQREGTGAFFDDLAKDQGSGLVVIVVGRAGHSAERYARAMRARVKILGDTSRIDMVLAAADVVAGPGACDSPHTSARFVTDALRVGRPVALHPQAPGAELLEEHPDAGVIVGEGDTWGRALGSVFEDHERFERGAGSIGGTLSLDNLLARLENELALAGRA